MATVTATIVVNFNNEGKQGILTAEIDSREDGYNQGRTSFAPGDQPAFLIFKSSNVTIDSIETSAGNIGDLAGGTIAMGAAGSPEYLTFANATEATLQHPITGALTSLWLGNDLGTPAMVGDSVVRVPTKGVGVLKVEYDATFEAHVLSGLTTTLNGETEYQVLIVITGTAA